MSGVRRGACSQCGKDAALLGVPLATGYGVLSFPMCITCRTGDAARWDDTNPWTNPADQLRHKRTDWRPTMPLAFDHLMPRRRGAIRESLR